MIYADRVRHKSEHMPIEQAVDEAVDECIAEGVLKDFLLKNKAEVKHMSIFEYDEEAFLKSEREVWREEGIGIGRAEGVAQGMARLIVEFLERLGDVPDALRTRLESETEAEKLSKIHKVALSAKNIQEFTELYESECAIINQP